MTGSNNVIMVQNICYKNILKDYSLKIEAGNIYGIIGPSGIGKSTLIKILAMITQPDRGLYYYKQTEVYVYKDKVRSKYRNNNFGYISQDYSLIENMDGYENIMVPYRISGDAPDSAYVEEICNALNISHILNQNVTEMSGGERQRIAIARAIIKKPDVLFADEPTSSLDKENASQVINIIKRINEQFKTTVVIATHDENICSICDKIIYL